MIVFLFVALLLVVDPGNTGCVVHHISQSGELDSGAVPFLAESIINRFAIALLECVERRPRLGTSALRSRRRFWERDRPHDSRLCSDRQARRMDAEPACAGEFGGGRRGRHPRQHPPDTHAQAFEGRRQQVRSPLSGFWHPDHHPMGLFPVSDGALLPGRSAGARLLGVDPPRLRRLRASKKR